MKTNSFFCIVLGSLFSLLGIGSVVILPPGINLLWSMICFFMAGVIFTANFYDIYHGGNRFSNEGKKLKAKEIGGWLITSSLTSFFANIVLPIIGGILISMYFGTSTCFKKNSNFILTILVSFSCSITSGLFLYWTGGVLLAVFSGALCFFLFWRQYFFSLKYPRTV